MSRQAVAEEKQNPPRTGGRNLQIAGKESRRTEWLEADSGRLPELEMVAPGMTAGWSRARLAKATRTSMSRAPKGLDRFAALDARQSSPTLRATSPVKVRCSLFRCRSACPHRSNLELPGAFRIPCGIRSTPPPPAPASTHPKVSFCVLGFRLGVPGLQARGPQCAFTPWALYAPLAWIVLGRSPRERRDFHSDRYLPRGLFDLEEGQPNSFPSLDFSYRLGGFPSRRASRRASGSPAMVS